MYRIMRTHIRGYATRSVAVLITALAPSTVLAQASSGLDATAKAAGIAGVAGGSIDSLVARVIAYVLGLTGIVFMGLVIYSGFLWMTAAGNEEKVSQAKRLLAAAVIGIAIVTGAYYITEAVFQAYGTVTATEEVAP
jgi:hypothetical protein